MPVKDGMMMTINHLWWAKTKFRNGPIIVAEINRVLIVSSHRSRAARGT